MTTIKSILHELYFAGIEKPFTKQREEEALQQIEQLIEEAKPDYYAKKSRLYFSPNINPPRAHRNAYRLGTREYLANLKKIIR